MSVTMPYTRQQLDEMRRENDKVLSKINISEIIKNPRAITNEERQEIDRVVKTAFKKVQEMGIIK